jgi:hypothetical protein
MDVAPTYATLRNAQYFGRVFPSSAYLRHIPIFFFYAEVEGSNFPRNVSKLLSFYMMSYPEENNLFCYMQHKWEHLKCRGVLV